MEQLHQLDEVKGLNASKYVQINVRVVAAPMVNSDATLELGARVDAVSPALSRCLSLPLMAGESLVAVLTLYTAAPDGFMADHGRLAQIVAPHLAKAIDAALRSQGAGRETVPLEPACSRELRLVASR